MNTDVEHPISIMITAAVILICQSIYLFRDARKNGHNYWFWGIIGMIQAPMPLLVYLFFIKKQGRKNDKR
ncbi:sigma-Y antisigma factor component [Cytobacillus gottheilii]|uniref:sigma-Y antisigma factor component n=1 Tax=Cytobacillus gottheilii TaxID=859144 RepID=UPI0009BC27CE|nr:sigma-Y antisigma factor component [Cytobacillus gottheilii]